MFKKLLSIFVLLTIVGSAWADVSWDFTNSNDHNLTKNGVTLTPGGSWGWNWGGFQFRAVGASLSIPVTRGQTVTLVFTVPNKDYTHRYKLSVSGAASSDDISFMVSADNPRHIAVLKAPSNGNIVITSTQNNSVLLSLEIKEGVYFEKNGNIVTSDVAEFIELNYTEPTLMGTQQGDEITYSIVDVSGGRIASFLDSHNNDIMFINCGVCEVHAKVKRYGNEIADESYRLTIKADNATYEVNKYTYTLTGNGKLLENVVRGQVPQITMSFGNPAVNNATMVRNNDGGNTPVATILDENGWRQVWMNNVDQGGVLRQQPYQGSFYAFTPETDGLLTVRGFFNNTTNTAYFVDADNLAPARINSTEYLTSLVDKTWGGIGEAATSVAPAVNTADGDNVQMREVYRWDRIFGEETPIEQIVEGLPQGTYTVKVYANAQLTTGRNIKQRNSDNLAEECGSNVAAICCQGDWNNLGWITPAVGGSVNSNQEITINNVSVSADGKLKIQYLTNVSDEGTKGVNWITLQIKSIERTDAPTLPDWSPLVTITATSNNEEVVTKDIELKKGKTYYLYGNTPNTNGGGWLTYQLHSFTFIPGISFAEWSHVLGENETSYTQKVQKWDHLSDVTYSGVGRGGLTATVNSTTGEVSNFVGDGGAIIVTASKTMSDGSVASDFYVITKPYKTHKWTFANMNYTDDDKEDLACSDLLLDGSLDWAVNYKVRNYNETTGNLYYINVPVMTNNTALHGENAAYIGTTAGLLVEANSKCFGSNATVSNLLDDLTAEQKNDAAIVDATLRQMLLYTKNDVQHDANGHYTTNKITFQKGAKIIIPALKAGQYVRVKWARYYGNDEKNQHQGEFIQVTNLDDAEGNPITRNIRSWAPQNVNKSENEYGYYVFKVHDNGPVSFEPQDNGWTNIYSIEVADEFEKIDYIVSGQVPSGKVMTDTDLRLSDIENVEDNKFKKAPTSFTHKYGESATHQFANQYTSSTEGLVNNPSVGSRSQYGLNVKYSLEGLDGTANLMPSLTANVNSGNGNGVKGRRNANGTSTATSITEDGLLTMAGQGQCVVVQKAYEGEYVVDIQRTVITITQDVDITWDYPYTWDFTNISEDTASKLSSSNTDNNWASTGETETNAVTASTDYQGTYTQGAMLTTNGVYDEDNTSNRIPEYNGLGFNTSTAANNAAVSSGMSNIGIIVPKNNDEYQHHNGVGGLKIGSEETTTIVVPDVPAGMTVYVRLEEGTTSPSVKVGDSTTPSYTDGDGDDAGEKVYSYTNGSETADVKIEVKDVIVKGIAVSKFTKTCWFRDNETDVYYNTDSHASDIDYSLTEYYTGNAINAYYVAASKLNEERQVSSLVLSPLAQAPSNTGYIVSTEYTSDPNKANASQASNYMRPLFVPCDNDKATMVKNHVTTEDYQFGYLYPHLEKKPIPQESDYDYYVFTNLYYNISDNGNTSWSDKPASVPGFYKVPAGDGTNLEKYRAYLRLPKSTSNHVKSIPLFDFDGELVDAIDVVSAELSESSVIDMNGTFYTLQGMKVEGFPKKSGIYMQNGKKILVK